jgi:hypothetical protein
MSILADTFMARDLIHEALGCNTAFIHAQSQDLILTIPLRPTPHGGQPNLVLTVSPGQARPDQLDPPSIVSVALDPNEDRARRTFRLARNNLLGYLGLDAVPLLQRTNPALVTDPATWLGHQMHELLQMQFDWNNNQSGFLHPKTPLGLGDNFIPYYRMNIYEAGHHRWSFKINDPKGNPSILGPRPHEPSAAHARIAAERAAIKAGHFPVYQGKTEILCWNSRWTNNETAHTVVLTNAKYLTIALVQQDDEALCSTTLCDHNGAELHGSNSFDSPQEALQHALHLIRPLLDNQGL